MYNNIIKLIATAATINEYGDRVVNTTEKTVFATLGSISQSEYYNAYAVGLKPEIKFIIPDYLDYNGELFLKFTPFKGVEEIYSIIRTYRKNNTLELICKKGLE